MNSSGSSAKLLLAASGGDTVKLFNISLEPQNPCALTYSPSPGCRVNSVKWNHNNLVLASAGDDKEISLWRKNGKSLWTVPAKNAKAETVQPQESISTINFSNKGSRYLCSGGTGQVVKIWDLQNKRCVKWLKGHTDTVTGVMYNCKDEHIASISRKGDIIIHNLASGARAAELRDPNRQVLGALDYSRMSRHFLVTAGDDGSIHYWDTTGRSPKISWLKQHSAPTSGVSFSPSNDKIIASVGLDMKLYTFDTGSKKSSFCIPYDAPFSSLAFNDDGVTLAAGTSRGQVVFYDVRGKPKPITILRAYGSEGVTSLCWQRSKHVNVHENRYTDETILLAGDLGDSIIMPDPVPSRLSSSLSRPATVSGSINPSRSTISGDLFSSSASSSGVVSSVPSSSIPEESSLRSIPFTNLALARLHAPRKYNVKDDMEVFSPLVEVQPITPSLAKLWDNDDGSKNDLDIKSSFPFSSKRFGLLGEATNNNHPISERNANSGSKQDDTISTFSQLTSSFASAKIDDSSSTTTPEAWGGERFLDKFTHRKSVNIPSRFAMFASSSSSSGPMQSGLSDSLHKNLSTSSLTSGLSLTNLNGRETSNQDMSLGSSRAALSSLDTKSIPAQTNLDALGPALSLPRRFSSYTEKIGVAPYINDTSPRSVGSPKSKKTGTETREELLNGLLLRSETQSATGTSVAVTTNGGVTQSQKTFLPSDSHQGTSFTLQLFQQTLEETLASFQKSIHEDMRNLHLEILRQFHMHETETARMMALVLENQAEIMKELQSLKKETKQVRQLL